MPQENHSSSVRVAACQINPTVGDIAANTERVRKGIAQAREASVQVLVFPELCLSGYPPKDLLLKTSYIDEQVEHLHTLVEDTLGMLVFVGLAHRQGDTFNSAAILHDGELVGFAQKVGLPNYRVFDEKRYFRAGDSLTVVKSDIANIGVLICEDLWHPETVANMASTGVDALVCLSASPFSVARPLERETMIRCRCVDHSVGMVFCNQVGGQDELIFDGNSMIVNQDGTVLSRGDAFRESMVIADLRFEQIHRSRLAVPMQRDVIPGGHPGREDIRIVSTKGTTRAFEPGGETRPYDNPFSAPWRMVSNPVADAWNALVLGVRDYVNKNGFRSTLVGLSGGIDSALTAALAVEALGPGAVLGVSMPSRYSSQHSKDDAAALAANLGIEYKQFAIESVFKIYLDLFEDEFRNTDPGITEENLQARIRGNLLMALSNKFGHLVLATGNKSELAVGYSTLYGDMCGGLSVIGDVPKTMVYALSLYCNEAAGRELIPQNTIDKPPSAELREDQFDTDSLPDYDTLDAVLFAYIEQDCSIPEIVELGYDPAMVQRIVRLVDRAEYKRRQAAIVLRVTSKAFGSDRRLPVTNKYTSG